MDKSIAAGHFHAKPATSVRLTQPRHGTRQARGSVTAAATVVAARMETPVDGRGSRRSRIGGGCIVAVKAVAIFR